MTKNERLKEEYWVYKELISTLSFDHAAMPKDHFSHELVRVMRESENTGSKIKNFESVFTPLLSDNKKRVSKYKNLIDSPDVFELLCDENIKRYISALYFSKQNDVFNEKDMLVSLKQLVNERSKPYLYNVVSKFNQLVKKH
jgi:hypothetical protein